ncbi:MAG: MCE family protein [Rhodococcus sp. (in: high G+C Gram-positive bacteria)]|uniref:MCE family protein n=1 Tax=Rhodococcus sp. TaxID=1831 RepID=UPI003BB1F9B1
MTSPSRAGRVRLAVAGLLTPVLLTGCNWQGLNSLALPGAEGRGSGSIVIHIQMENVGTLTENSPVLMDDVVVGSVTTLAVNGWSADVDVSVRGDVVVPANAIASVGQTSLLGSSHLQLRAPTGTAREGELKDGDTVPLSRSGTYPSTEQTLSSLSVVLNGGGLGQLNDIMHELNLGLDGRQDSIRSLLGRLDTLVGTLDAQRGDIITTIDGLNRLAAEVSAQDAVVADALDKLPPALQVLVDQQRHLVDAATRLGTFSDTATHVIDATKSDLLTVLNNLAPTLRAVADAGPVLGKALAGAALYPFSQYVVDHQVRGDYMNLFATLDLRVGRFRNELLAGTPLGRSVVALPSIVGSTPATAPHSTNPLAQPVTPATVVPPPDPLEIPGLPPIHLPPVPGLTLPGGGR